MKKYLKPEVYFDLLEKIDVITVSPYDDDKTDVIDASSVDTDPLDF